MSKQTLFTLFALVALVFGSMVYAAPQGQADNQRPDFVPGEVIVKFKGDTTPFQVLQVARGQEVQAVQAFQQRPDVIYAEPNYIVQALGSNDTQYVNQWALNNTAQTILNGFGTALGSGTADADVDWEEGWSGYSTALFSDAVVAIVDSGIDETHPDLNDKLVPGWDFVDGDNNPHDIYGHGTHVAGIAAAETNNAIGIAGVAFSVNVKIMPVRVLNNDGFGSTSDVALGIRYAADNGAKAINLSLGRRQDSNTLRDAVNYAWNRGAVLAAAAGNDGGGGKYYPASYPVVMSVAATDYNDNTASFSNFNSEVDISAPGVNVYSTFPTSDFTIGTLHGRSKNYDVGSGTSMSTPHVAGLAALLFAQDSTRTNSDVRSLIETTADDKGNVGWDQHYGWGRVNVFNALSGAVAPPPPPDGGGGGKPDKCTPWPACR
ncbi:MAG: S8 family peptidase [bacterium]|nr:S8 family peptidase [bacterium]